LAKFRSAKGDATTLKAVEGKAAKGDLARFFEEQALPEAAAAQAQGALAQARLKLARMKLIEMETVLDPKLKAQARRELVQQLKTWFENLWGREEAAKASGRKLDALVAELGESLQRSQLAEAFPAERGFRILSNFEIVRKLQNFTSVADYVAQGGNKYKLRFGRNGEVFESITEVDAVVAEPTPAGKLKPVRLEQAKTGAGDSPTQAASQNTKAITGYDSAAAAQGQPLGGLRAVAAGDPNVRVFERLGGRELGRELTADLDLTGIDAVEQKTRGPQGKGFDASFPFPVDLLQDVAASLQLPNYPRPVGSVKPPQVSPEPEHEPEDRDGQP
jgi:hypothetical protein